MPLLRFCLLGKFDARIGDQAILGLEAGKAQELLSYLLLHRNRSHPREAVADTLWGEQPTARSKKGLRQALWQVQAAVASGAASADEPLLRVDSGWVRLDSAPGLWLDVSAFEAAFARVRNVAGRDLDDESVGVLADAVSLYRGDLLEGCYSDWCLYERERLQHIYLVLLDKLMAASETRANFEDGLLYGALTLRVDAARETTHRRMMRLHYLSGDRTEALRQYSRCVASLADELGVAPAESTNALYEHIRASRPLGPQAAPSTDVMGTDIHASTLDDVVRHLRQVRSLLADLQLQVHQDLRAAELAQDGRP